MAASSHSQLILQNLNSSFSHYNSALQHSQNRHFPVHNRSNFNYDPLCAVRKSATSAANFYSSSHFPAKFGFINSQITTTNANIIGRESTKLPAIICSASSEESSKINQTRSPPQKTSSSHQQLLHHVSLRMILEIITFIWRLPSIITGFLQKEEKFIDTVEDDINEAADVVKVSAKVIEEVAEGLEKVSQAIEKDAEAVDTIMDKVKEKTKVAHDELKEVSTSLEGLAKDAGKNVAKGQVIVKVPEEEAANTPTTTVPPPPPTNASPYVTNDNLLHYKPFQVGKPIWGPFLQCSHVLFGVLSSLQLHLLHVKFEPRFYMSSHCRALIGTLTMVSFFYILGVLPTNSLIPYVL